MRITLRITSRSKRRTEVNRSSAFETGESNGLPLHTAADPKEEDLAPSAGQEHKIASGVKDLKDSVDLSKSIAAPTADSSSPSEVPTSATDHVIELDQISVEEVQLHPGSRIVMHTDPHSAGADRFRFLRMCLRELWNSGKLKSVQITSPMAQDGKSTIALNLATALAERGKRKVLLMEADLHRPTLTEQLGIEMGLGLADCLEDGLHPNSAIRRLEPLGWYLLPAGNPRSDVTELLQTEALAGLLHKLSPHFDWILIDSPPVIPLTDALSIARQANATLLVAREGRTPSDAIERAIAILGRQRVLGVVLNAVEGLERMYSGYYGYGGYSNGNGWKGVARTDDFKASLARPRRRSVLLPPEE